jgi:acetyl esterase/lipase
MLRVCLFVTGVLLSNFAWAAEPIDVWPNLAPGETTRLTGEKTPPPPNEVRVITRVINITQPTMTVHLADKPNGSAMIILPGGGFGKVVPDLEGTEAADWLNSLGVTAFVLNYRTTEGKEPPGWVKPLQDAQRAMALVRSQAEKYGIQKDRLGILGFSAGGQVTARLLSDGDTKTYEKIDDVDSISHRPDFAILVYPWRMYDPEKDSLVAGIEVAKTCPSAFIVHTDDDHSSSLGAVLFYAGLKKHGIPAELHVYGNGGHGYGLRPVEGSEISTWPAHAANWLGARGLLK